MRPSTPRRRADRPHLCPSAPAEDAEVEVFGVVVGDPESPRVAYLDEPQPMTPALRALADGVRLTEVFRTASPCAEKGCQHFSGHHCRLAEGVVAALPAVQDELPPCAIRPECRWFAEQQAAACTRCPQIVTERPTARAGDALSAHTFRRQLRVL